VIENGVIAEQGTPAELLRARGHYYKLYTQQFGQERAAAYGAIELARLPTLPQCNECSLPSQFFSR
jgi:hypothetical protein